MCSQVIGERLVVPSSIVYLVLKLRVSPLAAQKVGKDQDLSVEETKRIIKQNEEKDQQFLTSRDEVEALSDDAANAGWAHAPYWPSV